MRRLIAQSTGQYLRHWGACGQNPVDDEPTEPDMAGKPDPNFKNPVHWVRVVVELPIAASIVYHPIQSALGASAQHRWLTAGGFGLVHGFGFSMR